MLYYHVITNLDILLDQSEICLNPKIFECHLFTDIKTSGWLRMRVGYSYVLYSISLQYRYILTISRDISTTNIPYTLLLLLLLLLFCVRLVFTYMNPDKNVCIPYHRKHLWRNVISANSPFLSICNFKYSKMLLTIYTIHYYLVQTTYLVCLQVWST